MNSAGKLRLKDEAGSALIVSLIMLLLLSLIGLSGMQSTILQERMASNLHDRNIAFQAQCGLEGLPSDFSAASLIAVCASGSKGDVAL